MSNMTIEERGELKIRRVRARAAGDTKTLGLAYMIADLPLVCTRKTATWATNGVQVFWNPDFTDNLTEGQVLTLLLHEAEHIARLHPFRLGGRDLGTANIAMDYGINGDLIRGGLGEWIDGLLYHIEHSESGKAYEYIYDRLMEEQDAASPAPPEPGSGEDCQDGEGEGDGDGGDTGDGKEEDKGEDDTPSDENNSTNSPAAPEQGGKPTEPPDSGPKEDTPSSGGENSSQGGDPSGAPPPNMSNYGGVGEVWAAPEGVDPTELEKQTMERLAEAITLERAAGNASNGICQTIADGMGKVEPWGFLREHLRRAFSSETTWRRPNRRYIHKGLHLPGKDRSGGDLHIAIDTSGSVSGRELKVYLNNVRAIAEEIGLSTLKIAYIDSQIHRDAYGSPWQEIDVRAGEEIVFETMGGGGTSFDPIFTEIEDSAEEVACLIYMTDGYGRVRCPEPSYPVVWLTSGATPLGHRWGEVIDISRSINSW
jgi:predicted metal-dependent peptidase